MSKHKRSRSFNGPEVGWTESSHGIVGTAKGVGKGVIGVAAGATKMFTSPRFGSTGRKTLRDSSPTTRKYLLPKSQNYPKYSGCVSGILPIELPLLKIHVPTAGQSISIEIGPGDGLFECSDDLPERKKILKNLSKKLQQNPNALREDDSPYVKYDLGMEDIKLKLLNLKEVEKKIKPTLSLAAVQRKDRLLYSDPRIAGKSIDTYAHDYIKGEKAGQPNCDSYYAEGHPRYICFAVADGIGWGRPSRCAAQAALLGFSNNMKAEITKRLQKTIEWDTVMMADVCRKSLDAAHIFVNATTEAKTTFAGGVIVELSHQSSASYPSIVISSTNGGCSSSDDESDILPIAKKQWVFVGVSVGDSLIYRYSSLRKEATELTISDRTFGVRDAGGSLGGAEADLRNLGCHFCLLDEGDFVIAVSDGVHDNLDPEILKYKPSHLDVVVEDDDWMNVADDLKNDVKRTFKEKQLAKIIAKYSGDQQISAQTVVNNVIEFVWENTNEHRSAYERGSELQRDWDKLDPATRDQEHQRIQEALKSPVGKFDHVTCLCIKVASI